MTDRSSDGRGQHYSEQEDSAPKPYIVAPDRGELSQQERRWRDFASGMVILVLSYATLLACALGWWFTR